MTTVLTPCFLYSVFKYEKVKLSVFGGAHLNVQLEIEITDTVMKSSMVRKLVDQKVL